MSQEVKEMTKSLIVYFSLGGTTAQVAAAVAVGLRTAGHEVALCNLKNERPPDLAGYDGLGIGTPAYYFRPPFNVTDYVSRLPTLNGRAAFTFVLHGTYPGDAGNVIRRALTQKQAREVGYFHCHGADFFLGYLKEGYLFSPAHPVAEELAQAEAFGRSVAACMAGAAYVRPPDDPAPALIYRIERFLVNRWFTRQMYSRMFMVNKKKCTACGLCRKACPTGNIGADKAGRPVWGRECLLCLQCEMKCPQGAILSPVSWPFFRPTMLYNVHHASRDAALAHVRVQHRQGRTRQV
jgi:flavodoxin/NAD-dependent dihydropyrimidine dehydrogenase PreA subunit